MTGTVLLIVGCTCEVPLLVGIFVHQQDKNPSNDRHFRASRARVAAPRSDRYCNSGANSAERLTDWRSLTEKALKAEAGRLDDVVARTDARFQNADCRVAALVDEVAAFSALESGAEERLGRLAQQLEDLADRAAEHRAANDDRLGALQRDFDAATGHVAEALEAQWRDLEQRMGAFVNGCDELVRAEIAAQLADVADPLDLSPPIPRRRRSRMTHLMGDAIGNQLRADWADVLMGKAFSQPRRQLGMSCGTLSARGGYVNYLDVGATFRDLEAVSTLNEALHRALGFGRPDPVGAWSRRQGLDDRR